MRRPTICNGGWNSSAISDDLRADRCSENDIFTIIPSYRNMAHYTDIPNWQLFIFKFEPTQKFIERVESRFDALKNTQEYEAIAKHINIQIGLLNLRDREMAQEVMKGFGGIFQN